MRKRRTLRGRLFAGLTILCLVVLAGLLTVQRARASFIVVRFEAVSKVEKILLEETVTSTPTATSTPTGTATSTPTETSTATLPAPTSTSTMTRTPAPTATMTPSDVPTATRRFTNTPTPIPTASPTVISGEFLGTPQPFGPDTWTPTPGQAFLATPTSAPLPPTPFATETLAAGFPAATFVPSQPAPAPGASPSPITVRLTDIVTSLPSPVVTRTPAIFGPLPTEQRQAVPARPTPIPSPQKSRNTQVILFVGGGAIFLALTFAVAALLIWRSRRR